MQAALFSVVLLAFPIAALASVQQRDLVGFWKGDASYVKNGTWEFRSNGEFEFFALLLQPDGAPAGNNANGGHWRLRRDGKLELIEYSDYLRHTFSKNSVRETIIIAQFTPRRMRIRFEDGRITTWIRTKRPNQTMQPTAVRRAIPVSHD